MESLRQLVERHVMAEKTIAVRRAAVGTGSKPVRPRRETLKQKRENERAGKIGQLTQTREELNRRLGEITKELEDLAYPEMVGWTLVHRLYGEGIVEQQNDAVLTIRYGDTERRQKLPAVLTGGTASTDNTDAMEMCARVESLEKERTSIESKLKLNWHGLDALLNPQPHSRRSRV